MEAFAQLVDKLYFTSSNLAKAALIKEYLEQTPDPDRGWALAAIAGTLNFDFFKRRMIKDLILERVDPTLFELSYDYVGEMSETVAHLWQASESEHERFDNLPSLSATVDAFQQGKRAENKALLIKLLNSMDAVQRWALLKLGTRGLRIGVSARFLKKTLAEFGSKYNEDVNLEQIERLWHGMDPPYIALLEWLENKAPIPDVSNKLTFQPVMLSHPVDEDALPNLALKEYQAEWKYDGIRVQLCVSKAGVALFSRSGDNISASFPELMEALSLDNIHGTFDGELVALQKSENAETIKGLQSLNKQWEIASFNSLQQRLNKKKPSRSLIADHPVGLIFYDCLMLNGTDLRELSLCQRVSRLRLWFNENALDFIHLSTALEFNSLQELRHLREQASSLQEGYIEGLMLKRKDSHYVAGRPKGLWYKWKRDPLLIDAVMMYAQRGHGKRSSYYSDYTFGCWQGDQLLPVGKAYSGFTDDELKRLDAWVRNNTVGRFGPVKEVKKTLVFELAFDSVHESRRHKSGLAMRFPRIHRIRWDKPAEEADTVESLAKFVS